MAGMKINGVNVYELSDFIVSSAGLLKLVLVPNERTLLPNRGWILKFHGRDGAIKYGQIFNKQIKFTREDSTVTIKALIHDVL